MTKGRGGGNTPAKLVEILNKELEGKSLRSISRATGLGLTPLSRYSKGTSEPSQATLEKLAEYFKVSVSYLRGEESPWRKLYSHDEVSMFEKMVEDLIKLYELSPSSLKESLAMAMELVETQIENLLLQYVSGAEEENEKMLNKCVDRLNIVFEKQWPDRDEDRKL